VDRFLPPYEPRQVLDPDEPVTIGAMVGPEAFAEVRYLAHAKQMQALDLIPQVADEFRQVFGRDSGGLIKTYRLEDAETIVIAWARCWAPSRTRWTNCAPKA
jgi:pyruvate ferredoxin oxidoreductase alpha subunit